MIPDQNGGGPGDIDRRSVLQAVAGVGIGTAVFQRALAAQVEPTGAVTPDMIRQAEWIAGLEFTEEERTGTAQQVQAALKNFAAMRQIDIGYDVPPAVYFHAEPLAGQDVDVTRGQVRPIPQPPVPRPDSNDELAFFSVAELAVLIQTRRISSVELTKVYLERLHRYDEKLMCVVSFADDLALRQAAHVDAELARGDYRGPLHGIPWGAKDLIAYPGLATTWGAPQFREQQLDIKATAAERLERAGAVLVAKLSLGALAWGDRWFGGLTRNPWNLEQGSSGSSAGSASAVVAGLVGFALGSETLGSIVSPCRRCGGSGLRPTFGRVSRHGCMPLAWSMDKLGPICRSIEDCALVLGAIHGADGLDPTAVDRPFHWPPQRDVRGRKVGFFADDARPAGDRAALRVLRDLGVELVPIELPQRLPASAMTIILNTEAACVFDELVRTNNLEGLNRWPNAFRQGQFVPAVEYLRANRLRTMLMRDMQKLLAGIDCYVGGDDLAITNLTGHPTVVMPNGLIDVKGVQTPQALTFTGQLFGESDLLAVAHAYQQATGFHRQRPPLPV